MKCPICGNPLRPSKKDPSYGLCDNCKKRFKLKKSSTQEKHPERAAKKPSQPETSRKVSKPAVQEQPQEQTKKKKKGGFFKFFLILVLLVILAGAAYFFLFGKNNASLSKDTSGQVTENNQSSESEDTFTGDSATFNDITISLVHATESKGGSLASPHDGNVFYVCEFEVVNNSSSDVTINSLSCVEAFCGDYSVSEDISGLLLPEAADKNSLDGTIAAGQTFTGLVTYQIPSNFTQMTFRITPDFWNGESATFTVPKE